MDEQQVKLSCLQIAEGVARVHGGTVLDIAKQMYAWVSNEAPKPTDARKAA